MADTSWFERGLLFCCTGCGACCRTHGEYAYVYLSDADVDAIARHLRMSRPDFMNTHCATDETGQIHLAEIMGDCAFLTPDNRCRIYPVRPKQCATWPFWSENLDKFTWHGSVVKCCEGVGSGKRYTKEEVLAIARERDEWYEVG
jgi:Fe-S-cluster containining protein